MNILQNPSPNYGSRNGQEVSLIVIHCTDGAFPYDMQYLQNPAPHSVVGPVSAHYVVAPNGDIHQLVDTHNAAWHAGRINNPTAPLKQAAGVFINPNQYSIGIETSLFATDQIKPLQKNALVQLVAKLCQDFGIPVDRAHIVGHHEIYSLKTCPGTISVDEIVAAVRGHMPLSANTTDLQAQVSKLTQMKAGLTAMLIKLGITPKV